MRTVLIAFKYDLKTSQTAYLERISSVSRPLFSCILAPLSRRDGHVEMLYFTRLYLFLRMIQMITGAPKRAETVEIGSGYAKSEQSTSQTSSRQAPMSAEGW